MRSRAKEWLKRYLFAEILSSALTIAAALLAYRFTNNRVATAIIATWAGNISYFGYILYKDIAHTRKSLSASGKAYTLYTFGKNVRALAVEFGPAELLDSFVVRPVLMYYLPVLVGSLAIGTILAKFSADITFYLPAIISYELSKEKFRKFD